MQPQVSLGREVITPGALAAVKLGEAMQALKRHEAGDWGNVSPEDQVSNDLAMVEGRRLISTYQSSRGVEFWIITEWDRSVTTILLPDEY